MKRHKYLSPDAVTLRNRFTPIQDIKQVQRIIDSKFRLMNNSLPNQQGISTEFVYKDSDPCKCIKSPHFATKSKVKELILINNINNFLMDYGLPNKKINRKAINPRRNIFNNMR